MRTLLALLLAATLGAAELKVGDAAPAARPQSMLKGEPLKDFRKGETYVIEFWATWCPPCVASIPHLTELQAKLKSKGVTVLGVHHANGVEAADAFVRKQGKAMEYSVAKDTNGTVGKAWLTAAGQNGIPCAFVVTGGKVAYIGHPMSLTEDKVVAMIEEAKESAPAPAKK